MPACPAFKKKRKKKKRAEGITGLQTASKMLKGGNMEGSRQNAVGELGELLR